MKTINTIITTVAVVAAFQGLAVPIVSNVQMKQIEGTKDVRITYDLADNFNTQLWMTATITTKTNVVYWTSSTLPLNTFEGDLQRWVRPGIGKEIIWHAGEDWNGRYTDVASATIKATIPNDPYEICAQRNLVFEGSEWYKESGGYDGYCACSGSKSSASCYLSTIVNGTGTISFYWKVQNLSYCSIELIVDNVTVMTAPSSWIKKEYTIDTPGRHKVYWRFSRNSTSSSTYYCGYVDQVEWKENQ